MSEQNGTTASTADENATPVSIKMDKGKVKAVEVPQDVEMEEEEESSDESEAEEQVRLRLTIPFANEVRKLIFSLFRLG